MADCVFDLWVSLNEARLGLKVFNETKLMAGTTEAVMKLSDLRRLMRADPALE
jgi:hypothetical protein